MMPSPQVPCRLSRKPWHRLASCPLVREVQGVVRGGGVVDGVGLAGALTRTAFLAGKEGEEGWGGEVHGGGVGKEGKEKKLRRVKTQW